MTAPKQSHSLVTYFGQEYKKKYKVAPVVNRYKAKYGFDSVLMDMDVEEAKKLIDYYLSTINPTGHTIEWFFYNYEKLAEAKDKTDADKAALEEIRERTRKRTEEWRARKNGNN